MEEWAAAYRPARLTTAGHIGALLDPRDLADIRNAVNDLKDGLLAVDNMVDQADQAVENGQSGEEALRSGLRQLTRTIRDAVATLDDIPGIRGPRGP